MNIHWFQKLLDSLRNLLRQYRLKRTLDLALQLKEQLNQRSRSLENAPREELPKRWAEVKQIERDLAKLAKLQGQLRSILLEDKKRLQDRYEELQEVATQLGETQREVQSKIDKFYDRLKLRKAGERLSDAEELISSLRIEGRQPGRSYGTRLTKTDSLLSQVERELGGLTDEEGFLRERAGHLRHQLGNFQQEYTVFQQQWNEYLTVLRHIRPIKRHLKNARLLEKGLYDSPLAIVVLTLALFSFDLFFLSYFFEYLFPTSQQTVTIGRLRLTSDQLRYLLPIIYGIILITLGFKAGESKKQDFARWAYLAFGFLLCLPMVITPIIASIPYGFDPAILPLGILGLAAPPVHLINGFVWGKRHTEKKLVEQYTEAATNLALLELDPVIPEETRDRVYSSSAGDAFVKPLRNTIVELRDSLPNPRKGSIAKVEVRHDEVRRDEDDPYFP